MSAWEYGALDNEAALEVLQRWDEWIDGPHAQQYDEAIRRFFQYWGDAVNYGDSVTNMEVIALLAIHLKKSIPLPARVRKAAELAINRELDTSVLNSWADPTKRKAALLALLNEIGAQVKEARAPRFFTDPSIHYRNETHALRDLMRLAELVHTKGYVLGMADAIYNAPASVPPFLQTLHRLMMHRIWEKDYNVQQQALKERRMMTAWYLGLCSQMSLEEVEELIIRVRDKS